MKIRGRRKQAVEKLLLVRQRCGALPNPSVAVNVVTGLGYWLPCCSRYSTAMYCAYILLLYVHDRAG